MKWKTLVCILGVVLWCTTAVMAGSGPPTTDKAPASTATPTANSQAMESPARALTADKLTARLPAAKQGGQTSRQDVIWDNYPGGYVGNLYSSQLDIVYPFHSQAADDFILEWEYAVMDVHWVGGYWNQTPVIPNTTAFHIMFYADDGTGNAPVGAGAADPTPMALAHYNMPIASVLVVPLGGDMYEYSVDLPDAFVAAPGVKYWIAIQSENVFVPQWGITDSTTAQLAPGVQGFPLLGTNYWLGVVPDLAFKLTGECVTPGICGNGTLECPEECDSPDDAACPGMCYPAGHEEQCTCMPPDGACCIALTCEFDSDETTCVDEFGGDWYPGESCEAVPPFECPAPPMGACCYEYEEVIYCQTVDQEACDAVPGLWYEGEICVEDGGDFVCPTYCDGEDVIYHNGGPTGSTSLACDRRAGGGLEAWIVDDVTFPTLVTITDLHWWSVTGDLVGYDWQNTDDYIILANDGVGGAPGTVLYEVFDVPNVRIWWAPWSANGEVYLYSIYLDPGITLTPGTYWFGMRPVNQGTLGQNWWVTTGDNGTEEVYFKSEYWGYPDWVKASEGPWPDTHYNVAFCITGMAEELPGACCDDCIPFCEDGVDVSDCPPPLRFAAETLCENLAPPCGQGLGACCYPDGTCDADLMCDECMAPGLWMGPGTTCDDCPCVVDCPPGGTDEGEPCGTDANGGCNMDPPEQFRTIAVNETVCGTAWAEGGSRDTDWYEIVVADDGTQLTFSGTAEFDFILGYVEWQPGFEGWGECGETYITGYISPYAMNAPCFEASVTVTVNAGTHWFFMASQVYEGMPCTSDYKDYWVHLEGPCEITCEGTAEGEPQCPDEYVDVTNGGCNSEPPVFGTIACGETVCGKAGTYLFGGSQYRDTDWYKVELTDPKFMTMTVEAEFPVSFGFVEKIPPGIDDCLALTGYLYPAATADPCVEASVTSAWTPPGTYYLFVAPQVYTGFPMCTSDYRLELTCDDPVGPIYDEYYAEIYPDGTWGGYSPTSCMYDWYEYPTGWINVWFYDHPFDPDRTKEIHIEFTLAKYDPAGPGSVTVALNYATDAWSTTGNPPGEPRVPPLPGDDEVYIARPVLIPETTVFEGDYVFDIVIEDYNPEWISIDIMGYNVIITGIIYHECVEGAPCPWDHTGDGIVNPLDVNRVKDHYDCLYDFANFTCPDPLGWDDPECPEFDHTDDCVVNPLDVNRVKDHYGPCP